MAFFAASAVLNVTKPNPLYMKGKGNNLQQLAEELGTGKKFKKANISWQTDKEIGILPWFISIFVIGNWAFLNIPISSKKIKQHLTWDLWRQTPNVKFPLG